MECGHYICFARLTEDKWLRIDDEKVLYQYHLIKTASTCTTCSQPAMVHVHVHVH